MNCTRHFNSYTDGFWRFIEEHLPNYYSRDEVLRSDILLRFVNDEEVCENDLIWITEEFKSDKTLVKEEIIRLEALFAKEALIVYYKQIGE